MSANEYQVDGNHYKKNEYQHWDWVTDTNLHYLLGCATKYVARWHDKNGIADLRKAQHYLFKAIERKITVTQTDEHIQEHEYECTERFCAQLGEDEAGIIHNIFAGEFSIASHMVAELIKKEIGNGIHSA
jgi:biotin-(acetyl-CoA carboxylase) ligase